MQFGRKIIILWVTMLLLLTSIHMNATKAATTNLFKEWAGEWNQKSDYSGSSVTISKVTDKTFYFEHYAGSGTNTGILEGTATIKGDKATYSDPDNEIMGISCVATFQVTNEKLTLKTTKDCNSLAGMGVSFGGTYVKKATPAATETKNIGLLTNAQVTSLKKIVGNYYSTFYDNAQLVTPKEKDLDGFNSSVFTSIIRGAATTSGSIMMFDAKGNVWAAVVSYENSKSGQIYYFTNVKNNKSALPKTISTWVKTKGNMKVVYKSK